MASLHALETLELLPTPSATTAAPFYTPAAMAPWGSLVRMVAQAAIPIFRAFATAYQQALQSA